MAERRLATEMRTWTRRPPEGMTAGPVGDDILHWIATIFGPKDSPYEGGLFFLDIKFPKDYPLHAPKVVFSTPVYHPNVNGSGSICLDMLKEHWAPANTLVDVLNGILTLMVLPNPDDPLVAEIANTYVNNREEFNKRAKEGTERAPERTDGLVPSRSLTQHYIAPLWPSSLIMDSSSSVEASFAAADEEQRKLMSELCIVVDANDSAVDFASKKECHRVDRIKDGLLHRAFSVFLFNSDGKLLLQQRADEKITYPGYWTNTCCSHPLHAVNLENTENGVAESESEEEGQIGVRRAAVRKLWHELGVSCKHIQPEDFYFLTRILYKDELGSADGVWGEHEVDYILFSQKDIGEIKGNPNEVQDMRWVSQDDVRELLALGESGAVKLTPWFHLICRTHLFDWWNALLAGDIESKVDTAVHDMRS